MAVINILGNIGESVQAEEVIREIQSIKDDKIKVIIASPGGNAFQGLMVYDALKASGKEVHTVILGLGASAASVIFMAGDTREMGEGALLMIHNSRTKLEGTADQIRENLESLDAIDQRMKEIYMNVAGIDEERTVQLLSKDSFMGTAQAMELGLATGSITDDIAACLNLPKEQKKEPTMAVEEKEDVGFIKQFKAYLIKIMAESPQAAEGEPKEKPENPEDAVAEGDQGEDEELKALRAENEALKAKIAEAEAKAQEEVDEEEAKAKVILSAMKDNKITMAEGETIVAKSLVEINSYIGDKEANATGLQKPEVLPTKEPVQSEYDIYCSLEGSERTSYFAENKDAIIKQMEK